MHLKLILSQPHQLKLKKGTSICTHITPHCRGRTEIPHCRGRTEIPHCRGRTEVPHCRGRTGIPHCRGRTEVPHCRGTTEVHCTLQGSNTGTPMQRSDRDKEVTHWWPPAAACRRQRWPEGWAGGGSRAWGRWRWCWCPRTFPCLYPCSPRLHKRQGWYFVHGALRPQKLLWLNC